MMPYIPAEFADTLEQLPNRLQLAAPPTNLSFSSNSISTQQSIHETNWGMVEEVMLVDDSELLADGSFDFEAETLMPSKGILPEPSNSHSRNKISLEINSTQNMPMRTLLFFVDFRFHGWVWFGMAWSGLFFLATHGKNPCAVLGLPNG